jgi:hypothetical protein
MSTRGAIGFVANGKWYVTYNHSDSYPSWLGMQVLEFCKTVTDWEELKSRVEKIRLVDEDIPVPADLVEKYSCYGVTDIGGFRVAAGTLENWYNLLRSIQGASTLYAVYTGNLEHMIDSHMFLADSGYCEWAYIIDLDEMTLNVYKGFNHKAQSDTPLPADIDPSQYDKWTYETSREKYYPVRLLYAYNLDGLPEFILGVTNEFKKQYREEHANV